MLTILNFVDELKSFLELPGHNRTSVGGENFIHLQYIVFTTCAWRRVPGVRMGHVYSPAGAYIFVNRDSLGSWHLHPCSSIFSLHRSDEQSLDRECNHVQSPVGVVLPPSRTFNTDGGEDGERRVRLSWSRGGSGEVGCLGR